MSDIHEKDTASINDVKRGLANMLGALERPSLREKVGILVELVYAKGRLRGYQECAEAGAVLLGAAPTERPSVSESKVQDG